MSLDHASQEVQLIILGGGCAGLSLAARLVQQRPDIALTIVESRPRYEEDRTWCGWSLSPHFFSDCAVSQWSQWRIVTPRGTQLLSSDSYPYEMIRASLVYEKARLLVNQCDSSELILGAQAKFVYECEDHVKVQLADGQVLRSPWVIDTRPQARVLTQPWLWQNFVGYVIELDCRSKEIDRLPTLMEFQSPAESVAQFMYTIPFEERVMLCECTRFSKVHGEAQTLEAELASWLNERFGDGWKLQRRESGSLPMAPPLPTAQRRIIHAGTRGGSIRISTGYAFHRIQRWADVCAQSFLRDGVPLSPARNPLLDIMDELFLRVLQEPSTSAAELFGILFESCPTDRLVRFLSGVPHASDLWSVARCLPWGKFLRQTPKLAAARWPGGTERPV
jgi:lycopene beta-cyclase